VVVNVTAADASSFRASQGQIAADMARDRSREPEPMSALCSAAPWRRSRCCRGDCRSSCSEAAARGRAAYLKRIKYGNRKPNRDATTWQATDPTQLPADTWMFEVVFDYDENHYEEIDLDPARPAAEQHRFIRASASAGRSWLGDIGQPCGRPSCGRPQSGIRLPHAVNSCALCTDSIAWQTGLYRVEARYEHTELRVQAVVVRIVS
jgi:Salmonella virulence plasmid 65kDa B protein